MYAPSVRENSDAATNLSDRPNFNVLKQHWRLRLLGDWILTVSSLFNRELRTHLVAWCGENQFSLLADGSVKRLCLCNLIVVITFYSNISCR